MVKVIGAIFVAFTVLFLALLLLSRASAAPTATPTDWQHHVSIVDRALDEGNIGRAERAWRDAHGVALRGGTWQGMAEVGDAALRIGTRTGTRKPYEPKARVAYLTALYRARSSRSVDGVLRVTESFLALGDRDVARQCLRVAESLTDAGDPEIGAKVRGVAERVSLRAP